MPDIKCTFSGSIKTEIEFARDKNGNEVDVSDMSTEEFVKKCNEGELFISFTNAYENSYRQNIDMQIESL